MVIVAAIENLIYFFQKGDQYNADYHNDFMAMLEVIEENGGTGSLTHFPNLLKEELEGKGLDLSKASTGKLKEGKSKKFLAAFMLNRANGAKYNGIKQTMKENFVTGTSTYPKSPETVHCILNAYLPPVGWGKHRKNA
jgi:hypothetical protein